MAGPTTPRRRRPSAHPAGTPHHGHRRGARAAWRLASALGVGLVFHLVYMLSIFDIYFRSPLVHGIEPVQASTQPPAKRLVLFVGDGCRADRFFEMKADGAPRAPFLHGICRTAGTFGVAHTRVPTESRPGHIAMIAGFYEDVSAVTKGWKANPVDYDHVLARAKWAWSFGAPEIVDLFSGPRVFAQHYAPEMIDFAGEAKKLDQWSFDRLHEVLEAASVDGALAAKLKSDQVVIFVHLLGLDTNGHAHKPHSREYLENIEYVDAKIKETVQRLEAFFDHDGRTAFIYTADHGMSDAGTHGDGDPANTRTPFVGWGAGLSGPQEASLGLRDDHDAYSATWGLSQFRRRDFNQADMAPLMASLVGIPTPVNSEGVLPIKHLGSSQGHKSRALLDNVKQLVASYLKKESLRQAKEPFFVPAPGFSGLDAASMIPRIEELIGAESYPEAQRMSFKLAKDCLYGLSYLHKYDSVLLKGICTAGYLGWILYVLLFLVRHFTSLVPHHEPHSYATSILFASLGVLIAGALMAKRSPLQFYVYAVFPLGFWHEIAQKPRGLWTFLSFPLTNARKLPTIVAYVAGLELLVLSFFQRSVLVGINGLVAASAFRKLDFQRPYLSVAWLAACSAMSAFPLMEPIKYPDEGLYVYGVLACMAVAILGYLVLGGPQGSGIRAAGFLARLALIGLAGYISRDSDRLLKAKLGLPIWNQNAGWVILCFSVVTPILANRRNFVGLFDRRAPMPSPPAGRLLDLFMTFAPAYILLSIAYEPLFYACFALQMALWLMLESGKTVEAAERAPSPLSMVLDNLWVCYGFLFFVNLGFFGTGNMASVSSFTLESVYRLLTVFSPFAMAALLILKLVIPFCLLSAAFGVLARLSGAPPTGLILLVVGTTDIMTLNFFYLVRDHGSWLEIGTSISHFVIASSLIVLTLVLFGASHLFLSGVDYGRGDKPAGASRADMVPSGEQK